MPSNSKQRAYKSLSENNAHSYDGDILYKQQLTGQSQFSGEEGDRVSPLQSGWCFETHVPVFARNTQGTHTLCM